MTSDGVDGTAFCSRLRRSARPRGVSFFIKPDDERATRRYIGPKYPHAPAGTTPDNIRRGRQAASALRRRTDFTIASLICGTAGPVCRMAPARRRRDGCGAV